MKRIKTGLAIVAVLGVVAGAWAARMQWASPDTASGVSNRTDSRGVALPASAAAAAGKRANGSQPLVPGGIVTLVGEVVELAPGGRPMSVVVQVGANDYPAVVQGTTYSVRVSGAPSNAMVKVVVESTRVHYESVLGTYGRLHVLAGADNTLSLSEQPALRVSPYTTALEYLARNSLGHAAGSDREFELAVRSVYSDELENAAYLISAVSAGTIALPTLFADGYGMLHDRDRFRDLYYDTAFLAAAKGYLDRQATQAPVASLANIPVKLAMMSALPWHELPMNADQFFLFDRSASGQALFLESISLPSPYYNVSVLPNGVIDLQPWNPYPNQFYRAADNTNVNRTRVRYQLRRLFQGADYSQWVVRLDWKEQVITWDDTGAIETGTDYFVLGGVDMDRWIRPEGWGNLNGKQVALPTTCPEQNTLQVIQCAFARQRFNIGGTGVQVEPGEKMDDDFVLYPVAADGVATTWSVDVAARSLSVGHDMLQSTYWKVDDSRYGMSPVVYRSRDTRYGYTRVGLGFQIPENTPQQGALTAEGDWWADDFRSLPATYMDYEWQRRVQRDGANNADYRTYIEGTWPTPTRHQWSFANGAWLDSRALVTAPMTTCAEIFPAICYSKGTYFRPLLRAGNRYYGVREEYDHYNNWVNGSDSLRSRSRAGFYDCLSGPCTGPNGLVDLAPVAATAAPARPAVAARAAYGSRAAIKGRAAVAH
ncbi:hypothetical protein [Pseudoxanthomonas indica]|uniref:hypothetical protein n=2 Tax=Pseudoxanthomonas indica TaxID=428993 RepID=UPI00111701A1|nr:hypothetical protein [Pseudoxanthomonas indica]